MGLRWAYRFAVAAALLLPASGAFASSGGITGQSVAGCTGCHSGTTSTWGATYTAHINGSATVAPSSANAFSVSTTHSSTNAPDAGFDLSASSGTFTAGTGSQVLSGELTHTAPKATTAGDVTWNFTYNAPATVGSATLFVCINPVNLNGTNDSGDGPSPCTSRAFTINSAPTATADARSVAEDSGATAFTVLSNDFSGAGANDGGDSITVTAITVQPTNGTASVSGGGTTATYTPNANFNGTDTFTYQITDSIGATDTAVVTVTVTAVNDPPSTGNTVNNVASYTENAAPVTIDSAITITDIDSANLNQATVSLTTNFQTGQDLLVCPGSPPAGITCSYNGASGVLTLSGSQTLANYELALEAVGYQNSSDNPSTLTRTVSVVVRDTGNLSSTADTTTLTVTAVNDPPTVVDDASGIAKNSTNNLVDVLINDSDPEGSSLSITAVGTPSAGGTVTISGVAPNQKLSYSPLTNYSGAESMTYTVSDGSLSSVGTFTATVSTGSAPVAVADAPSAVTEDSSGNVFDVLANDTDADVGDTKTITQVNGATAPVCPTTVATTHGTVCRSSASANNTLSYSPAANYNGADSFTYTMQDAAALTSSNTVSVTVTAVNDAPVAVADSPTVTEDSGNNTLSVLANDTDVDTGDTKTVTQVNGAAAPVCPTTVATTHGTVCRSSASANNTLSYAPAANYFGSDSFTYTMADSAAATSTATVSITVTGVNDPPVINSSAVTTATDGQLYTYAVNASDVDDAVDGTNVSFSLSGAPSGMTVSNSPGTVGTITWTPPCATYAQFTNGYSAGPITVSAQDGGENGAQPATQTFSITVAVPDSDGDGMPDCYETANGFNPNSSADAAQDRDGDGVSNVNEFVAGTNPSLDDVPPVLTVPADLIVPATGYFTVVDLGTATATDAKDGVLTPTSNWTVPVVRPGSYDVTWTVSDLSGNTANGTQHVDVLPLADFSIDQTSGEGQTRQVTVTLNGASPGCPGVAPSVTYTVGGTASAADHDAVNGTLQIPCSGSSASIPVSITADGTAEPMETVVFTMTSASGATLGTRSTHTLAITDTNVAPAVTLSAFQGAYPRLFAYQGDGTFTLAAAASDPNNDTLSYDWSGSDDALAIDLTGGANATFDPSGLAPGTYAVQVQVGDGNGGSASASVLVSVVAGSSTAVDVDADGIADGIDVVTDSAELLDNQTGDPTTALRLETEPGLSLRLGRTALAAGRSGALIAMSDLVTYGVGAGGLSYGADSFDNLGGIFDFEIHDLAPGSSVNVVLPLQTALLPGAVFRKFDPATGWHNFVSDSGDAVASAASAFGQCPGPGSTQYVAGLQPFADCVRLTLQDGGPNDADGVADGVIRDPGGAAILASAVSGGPQAVAGVDGGAWTSLWLLWLGLLRAVRGRRRLHQDAGACARQGGRAARIVALIVLLPLCAPASASEGALTRVSGEMSSGFDTNVANGQDARDVRESGTVAGAANVEYLREPDLYTTLTLRGTVAAEHYASFGDLSNEKVTGLARYSYRADGDFATPVWAAWVSAAYWQFGSDIRSSNEYRVGGSMSRQVTTQVSGRLALGYVRRDSASRVFDTQGESASVNVDWRPVGRVTIYTGYQYYHGQVVSTATTPGPLKIIMAAEVIEPDDAFGGAAANQFAYRLMAHSHIGTLGVNYPLSQRFSVDLQGQYIDTHAHDDNRYQRLLSVLSLLARF